jgi:hypothetical protein
MQLGVSGGMTHALCDIARLVRGPLIIADQKADLFFPVAPRKKKRQFGCLR